MTDFVVAIAVVFIAAAVILVAAFILMSSFQNRAGQQKDAATSLDDDEELSTESKLMLGAMGAKLLDNMIDKHEEESERKRKELFFWQDAIRDDMRDEGDNVDEDERWL